MLPKIQLEACIESEDKTQIDSNLCHVLNSDPHHTPYGTFSAQEKGYKFHQATKTVTYKN